MRTTDVVRTYDASLREHVYGSVVSNVLNGTITCDVAVARFISSETAHSANATVVYPPTAGGFDPPSAIYRRKERAASEIGSYVSSDLLMCAINF